MNPDLEPDQPLLISYLTLRKTVGILGILLPLLVSMGAWLIFQTPLQPTISDYYYTGTRVVFVGTLWALGFFFFSYKGYERRDEIAGRLAFVFALGVSLVPTAPDCSACNYNHVAANLHWALAGLLFLTLSYFSIVLFTLTDASKTPTRQKLQRNRVYKACGYTMLACILLIPATLIPAIAAAVDRYDPIFWLETIALEAFGVSWLTKGEGILSDQPE
jgi:uncharacterized membrane protein SirB2